MFTATITSVIMQGNRIVVGVTYNDSVTIYSYDTSFEYPADGTTTQAQVVNDVTTLGTKIKSNLTKVATIQAKVGSVITI